MSSNAPASSGSKTSTLLFILIVGIGGLILWLYVSVLQVQTSEATILGQPSYGLKPTLSVLQQWPDFVQGRLSPLQTEAFIYGWGIEILTLVFIGGFEIVRSAVHNSNALLGKLLLFFLICVVIYNVATDYTYAPPISGPFGRVGFALISAGIVAFLGIGCVALITHAHKNW